MEAWEDLTLDLADVVRLARRLAITVALGALLAYLVLWGVPPLPAAGEMPAWVGRLLLGLALFVVVYVASAVVHEGLHALAMMLFAGVSPRAIRFGLRLSEGVAYVHTATPMTVRAYRGVLALPVIVQGIVPLAVGLAMGSGWIVFYGYVMFVSAAGDLAVLRSLRGVAAGRLVRDHPTDVGCRLSAP